MKCVKNEGIWILTIDETLDLGFKSTKDEVYSEREVFWEAKRQRLSREIKEK